MRHTYGVHLRHMHIRNRRRDSLRLPCRIKLREQQRERNRLYMRLVVSGGDPLLEGRTTDDGIRYQSVVFAFVKSFDKMTKLVSLLDGPM